MRQILFKAQRVDGKGWVDGVNKMYVLYDNVDRVFIANSFKFHEKRLFENIDWIEVIPETVFQMFDCGSGSFFEDDKVLYEGKEYVVKFHLSFATLERCMCDHGENISIPIDEDVAYLMKVISNVHDKNEEL